MLLYIIGNYFKEDKTMKKLLAKIAVFSSIMALAVGISSAAVSAAVYKLTDAMKGQVILNDTYLGTGDYFTVVTGGNTMMIDGNTRSYIYDKNAEGDKITHEENRFQTRLKTSGDGNTTRRAIAFNTATDNATLVIYAVNGSSAAENAGRSITVEGPEGFTKVEGLCKGSNTEPYNGRNVGVARKETVPLGPAGTYYIYSPKGSFSIYELEVTDGDGEVRYMAPSDAVTSSVTTVYPDPSEYDLIHITDVNGSGDVRELNAEYNAVNHGGVANNSRIRLGAAAYEALGAKEATIENNGFITFDYADTGAAGFKVGLVAASSGASSSRDICLGIYENGEFTELDRGTAVGNAGTNIVLNVPAGGSTEEKTYAIYVEPYYKDSDDILDPAENTDIRSIELLLFGDYYTTPSITLDPPVKTASEVTVTGHFNDFSGGAFEVSDIWISAASSESSPEAAKWLENEVIYLKDNNDGTASFTAVFTEAPGGKAIIPEEGVKLQAHARFAPSYKDENVSSLPQNVSPEIVSNAVRYIP